MGTVEHPAAQAGRYMLLVDDEPAILSVVTNDLRDWAQNHEIKILAAKSAEQALTLLEQHGDDVWILLSDLRMPGMGGIELLTETTKRYPFLASLALSGEDNVHELSRTVRTGILGFIPKPWDREILEDELSRAFEYARLKRERSHYLRTLEFELQWAGELQQKLLEVELPWRSAISMNVVYRPLPWLSCGGDYYDVIPFRDDSVIVLIGDVAGHGVKAAFVTAMLKSMIYRGFIRRSLETGFSPALFLEWLNTQFLEQLAAIPDIILTFSATLINVPERRLTTAAAGHEPMFINGPSGRRFVSAAGPVIGVSEDVTYTNDEVNLAKGDLLTFLTDGASEYPKEGRRLTPEEVSSVLAAHPNIDTDSEVIFTDLQRALQMEEQQDDITMIRVLFTE